MAADVDHKGTEQQPLKDRLKSTALPADRARAVTHWDEFIQNSAADTQLQDLHRELEENPSLKSLLMAIFGSSPYLTGLITRHPVDFQGILNTSPERHLHQLISDLVNETRGNTALSDQMKSLRQFKKKAALTIAIADIGEVWDIIRIIEAVTETAQETLTAAVEFLFRQAAMKGEITPKNPDKPTENSGYIVLGMGKLGARELNYSSDVDLIILFDKDQLNLRGGLEPGPFFVRLTKQLIKLMQEITPDGYVFRMDLRLRPDPGATQIALSTEAAFAYYESFGQNWERAAMIKARPVAGDIDAGNRFLAELAPYIWRKYLDFAAIDDIHAMKRQIHSFKGHGTIAINGHDLKLGRGGIREIEFFAQTQQLIAGGRQPELRTRRTLKTLNRLATQQWIRPQVRDDLTEAYQLLRRLEHRLQMINDEQTHKLPLGDDQLEGFARFAGYKSIDVFNVALRKQLKTVKQHYEDLFEDDPSLASTCGNLVFVGDTPDPGTIETLKGLGFNDPQGAINLVKNWHYGRYAATRSPRAREHLTSFQPILIEAISKTTQPDKALATFDTFLKDLPAGVQLFSLLSSNPNLLRLVADIMGTAPSLAHILSRRTRLLDAVLDPTFFGELPDDDELHHMIKQGFGRCRDYQDTLDTARIIGQEQSFLTGVRLLSGVIDARQAASNYTRIAETMVEELQEQVLNELKDQYGSFKGAGVSVLAMGKLGGREMTASSDLDLILIYDHDEGEMASDGPKPLSPTQYYARLTQRLISALSAPTAEGELYEVDMRLRPSGRAGPVATHINSFKDYQNKQAWTWEHMALTRARPITGSDVLKQRLQDIISDVLAKPRKAGPLANDVNIMREKIRETKGTDNLFDIKLVRGGQVDLEFICQYLQLRDAHTHPAILNPNTEGSFLAMRETGNVSKATAQTLLEAAQTYNALIQMIRLCTDKGVDPESAGEGLKNQLAETLNQPSFSVLTETIKIIINNINGLYKDIIISKQTDG